MPEQDRVLKRKAAGLCTACCARDHALGLTKCEPCATDNRQAAAARRRRARARGLCEACMRRPAKLGRGRRCAHCADKYLKRQLERARRARLRRRSTRVQVAAERNRSNTNTTSTFTAKPVSADIKR